MTWKKYLSKIANELADYLKTDIQYSHIPASGIRQIAWREIEIFLEEFKKWPPEKLLLEENSPIKANDQKAMDSFLNRRLKGLSLAYIIGKQRFYGLDFEVNKYTLIPRPETEELVAHVLKFMATCRDGAPARPAGGCPVSTVIDIGTGSGCILAAVLKNLPKKIKLSKIYAIDKNLNALKTAKKNIEKILGEKYKIKFLKGSLLSRDIACYVSTKMKCVIVANLPYLSKKEYRSLSPEVKKYEPEGALVGGEEGHELICELIDQAVKKYERFEMFLEISPTIYPQIKKHCLKQHSSIKIKNKRDLSGKIRFLHLSR